MLEVQGGEEENENESVRVRVRVERWNDGMAPRELLDDA